SSVRLFENHQVDFVDLLSKGAIAQAERDQLRLSFNSPPILWKIEFNLAPGRLTANHDLRQAIALAFDSREFVDRMIGIPGTRPATGLLPRPILGFKRSFREEHPMPVRAANLTLAKQHLARAMIELGLKSPPTLTWLSSDDPSAKSEAEYFQTLFKKTL